LTGITFEDAMRNDAPRLPPGRIAGVLLAAAVPAALAHPGHGAAPVHTHASDAWGFAIVAAAALALSILRGRGR
jgi:hypothetical protein